MNDVIKLRTLSITPDAAGFSSTAVTEKTVYADIKSVRQSEFYAAEASGKKVDLVFVVNADEWNGATEIEYGSLVYSVVRAQDWKGRTELTCSRM